MIRFNSDKKRIFLEYSNKTRKVESNRLLAMVYIQIFFGGFDSESFESFLFGDFSPQSVGIHNFAHFLFVHSFKQIEQLLSCYIKGPTKIQMIIIQLRQWNTRLSILLLLLLIIICFVVEVYDLCH